VRVKPEKPQASELSREQLDQSSGVRLGQARDAHVLEMHAMSLGERRIGPRDFLQGSHRIVRNHLDVVNVIGRARYFVVEGGDEPTKAVNLNGAR